MTRLALDCRMRAGQREIGCAVIECRRSPRCRGVTCLTRVTEVSGNMIRIRCLLEIRLMALVAISVC